jgi:hypothetical protein
MAHKDGELIIVRKDFLPDHLTKHIYNELFPRRRTWFFHKPNLLIIFADDLVNKMPDAIYCDLHLNLSRKITFFHHDRLNITRPTTYDGIRRNY